ncbi:20S proteasome subunit A/B [Candidatus Acetothermia bacterium]|jgi:proteasome alpha subunit|nr:20S proteasome subunit A/B [Candidatus Acetothermia bacterium]MCI2432410.1 20S proteasome subunit A/B [Candidatus Acetothermia bacterium]MCI2436232.1 20S proteasome subunit A/B [Candidatus Acetothermia bacterium]
MTPYNWQQTLRQKADYVEDRLKEGSPVVALSTQEGILILTVRRGQPKIFEIYDRLAFSGLGNQSDLEAVRQLAVDFAHAEGFQRSADDVSIQRVVGVALSPALKQGFSDPLRLPLVLLGLFAQVEPAPEEDLFYLVNYDGEFSLHQRYAAAAGRESGRLEMEQALSELKRVPKLEAALEIALRAWTAGRSPVKESSARWEERLSQELQMGTVEAALLKRDSQRDRRFCILEERDLKPILSRII